MRLSRRQFVTSSALAAAALSLQPRLWAQSAGHPKIGVQLYSVRDDCAKDFDAALTEISKMGFEGVEFAGYHKYNGKPAELRKKLDELGLKGFSTHIGMGSLRGDELKKTIETHQIIGCKYLIVPHDEAYSKADTAKEFAESMNKVAETLKPLGMACGYHNHTDGFKKDGDKTFFELFAERTSKDVVIEQDCGWTAAAHADPSAMMKKYPGRCKLQHFKPTVVDNQAGKKAYFGEDSVDWVTTLKTARKEGGTEWVILEQEVYPDGKPAMECTKISLAGLKKIW